MRTKTNNLIYFFQKYFHWFIRFWNVNLNVPWFCTRFLKRSKTVENAHGQERSMNVNMKFCSGCWRFVKRFNRFNKCKYGLGFCSRGHNSVIKCRIDLKLGENVSSDLADKMHFDSWPYDHSSGIYFKNAPGASTRLMPLGPK